MATEAVKIEVKSRDKLGTRESKRLRKSGYLPAVVYGHGQEVLSVALPFREAAYHIQQGVHIFELGLDGKTEQVLIKDIQFDGIGKQLLHVDFFRVSADERVTVAVAVQFKGTPIGVAEHQGVLLHEADEVEIECRALEIPDRIVLDVSHLNIGEHITAGELKLPDGVTLITDPDHMIASVAAPRVIEDEPTEAPAEPELIGRKKEDEDDNKDEKKGK
ncbi:MAG: 50S ribosomal protein L25 [Phycisphaerae bacterium]